MSQGQPAAEESSVGGAKGELHGSDAEPPTAIPILVYNPHPFPVRGGFTPPPSLNTLSPDVTTAYLQSWNLTVEKDLQRRGVRVTGGHSRAVQGRREQRVIANVRSNIDECVALPKGVE